MKAVIEVWAQRFMSSLPPRGGGGSYLIAAALTVIALFFRLMMAPVEAGLQYITFFPSVTLAVIVGGFGPGILATVLGASLATFIFMPPHYSFQVLDVNAALISNTVFCIDGIIVCFSIEGMHRYRQRYINELAEAKLKAAQILGINKALQDSQAFGLSVFNSRNEQVAVLDENGVIIAVNEAWHRFALENGGDILAQTSVGKSYLDVCAYAKAHSHSGNAHVALDGILAVLRGDKEEFSVEYPCHSPTEERWFEMRVTPLLGTSRGVVIAHENITRRKVMEKVLRHSAAIIATSDDAIISKTLDGYITSWNKGAEQIYGYTQDEATGHHISLITPELLLEKEKFILGNIRNGGILSHYETQRRRKDGKLIDVSVTVSPLVDESGTVVGASAVARDISEKKLAEQELRIAATAFEAQEGMMVTDANCIILRVNQAFTEHTGYSGEEVVGHHVRLLCSGRHDRAFYETMWSSIHSVGAWKGEIWNRRKNGEVYPEWLTITAVKNVRGEATHYVGTHTDITVRKAAEDEIKHLAFYDPLTRLPNRRLLMDRLQQALATSSRTRREGALMFIDLDRFKMLNDTLGHDKGDLLLQQVAERLNSCVRVGDTVARIGGDEFVIILEVLSEDHEEAARQAENVGWKIIASLNQAYMLAGHEFHSTPSIGITLFGRRVCSIEDTLKEADSSMYQAKASGRNTLRFFESA